MQYVRATAANAATKKLYVQQIVDYAQCLVGVHHVELVFLNVCLDLCLLRRKTLINVFYCAHTIFHAVLHKIIGVVVLLLPHFQVSRLGIVLTNFHAGIHVMTVFRANQVNGTQLDHLG